MLKIVTYPSEILDKKSAKVELPLNEGTKKLIRDMYKTVTGQGVGLAAPQVGVSKQLCIIKLDKDMADKKDKQLEFVMINPEITFYSKAKIEMTEGCLSFPGQYYNIIRSANITVKFLTIQNFRDFVENHRIEPILQKKELTLRNWMSRVIQHEVDHLNGKVFINLGGLKVEEDEIDRRNVID